MSRSPVCRSGWESAEERAVHAPVVVCPPEEDVVRAEFEPQTRLDWILKHFGAERGQAPPVLEEVDFSLDLQTAISRLDATNEAFNRLAPDVRQAHPDWPSLLAAIQAGKVGFDGRRAFIHEDPKLVEQRELRAVAEKRRKVARAERELEDEAGREARLAARHSLEPPRGGSEPVKG